MDETKRQKIIRMAIEQKLPLKDIASRLYITERQLRLLFGSWGVAIPHKRKYMKVPTPDRRHLMNLYKKYRTTAKVAEYMGVSIGKVNSWMRELKIPTRKMKMSDAEKIRLIEEHIGLIDNIAV